MKHLIIYDYPFSDFATAYHLSDLFNRLEIVFAYNFIIK